MKDLMIFGAVTLGLFVVTVWALGLPDSYREEGRNEVRAEYMRQSEILNARRDVEIETVRRENQRKLFDAKATYENELAKTNERYRVARVDGLRWKAASDRPAAKGIAEASDTCGAPETGENRLPEHVEASLFNLAREADRITLKLTTLQSLVRGSSCFVVEP